MQKENKNKRLDFLNLSISLSNLHIPIYPSIQPIKSVSPSYNPILGLYEE
jgi:hypothetical protein